MHFLLIAILAALLASCSDGAPTSTLSRPFKEEQGDAAVREELSRIKSGRVKNLDTDTQANPCDSACQARIRH